MGTPGVSNSRMRIFVQDTEIKLLRGDVACYVAQARAPIDADIGQKDHPWMETNYVLKYSAKIR